jgi:hypothetical protein
MLTIFLVSASIASCLSIGSIIGSPFCPTAKIIYRAPEHLRDYVTINIVSTRIAVVFAVLTPHYLLAVVTPTVDTPTIGLFWLCGWQPFQPCLDSSYHVFINVTNPSCYFGNRRLSAD